MSSTNTNNTDTVPTINPTATINTIEDGGGGFGVSSKSKSSFNFTTTLSNSDRNFIEFTRCLYKAKSILNELEDLSSGSNSSSSSNSTISSLTSTHSNDPPFTSTRNNYNVQHYWDESFKKFNHMCHILLIVLKRLEEESSTVKKERIDSFKQEVLNEWTRSIKLKQDLQRQLSLQVPPQRPPQDNYLQTQAQVPPQQPTYRFATHSPNEGINTRNSSSDHKSIRQRQNHHHFLHSHSNGSSSSSSSTSFTEDETVQDADDSMSSSSNNDIDSDSSSSNNSNLPSSLLL